MRIKITLLLLCTAFVLSDQPLPAKANSALQIGFHVDQADAAHLTAAQMAGGHFVVQLFEWANIEPTPGYHYWAASDAALRAAEFYGLGFVARLDHPPAWALDEASPTPWSLDAYAAFVGRVVARYGNRLDGIILWNEPNLRLEWNAQAPDPAAYVALLQAGAEAARAVNPTVPVFMAGLAFTQGGDGNMNDLDFLRGVYAAGGGAQFDGLALHPYGFGAPPAAPPAPDRLNFRRLELHRQIMLANGDGEKPVWITEMGWRVRTPDAADAWQVVTPAQQARYLQEAVALVKTDYPWIVRMAFWRLVARGDEYGFDLWQGARNTSPAYQALVEACEATATCPTSAATLAEHRPATPAAQQAAPVEIEIQAPDVIVRLGDRGTLHPHWVHLQRGDRTTPTLRWHGEFFLPATAIGQRYTLLLETMQIDQPLNQLTINGQPVGALMPRSQPDPTSTWVTQGLPVPADLLQGGVNTIAIVAGERNPAWQYADWRWENMQVRNIRLRNITQPHNNAAVARFTHGQPMTSPGGWAEAVRLRPSADQSIWFMGNRLGQLWHGTARPDGTWHLANQAETLTTHRFHDLLAQGERTLVATESGLFYRLNTRQAWQPVAGTPPGNASVLLAQGSYLYAGFADAGIWRSRTMAGPWQAVGLSGETVRDLVTDGTGSRYAATNSAIYWQRKNAEPTAWQRLPPLPEAAATQFATRLFGSSGTGVVARVQDRFWQWDGTAWRAYGPTTDEDGPALTALLDCCDADTLVAGPEVGLLRRDGPEGWQPLAATQGPTGTLPALEVMDLLRVAQSTFAATTTGLWVAGDGDARWQLVAGLPATVSDLLIDPEDEQRWFAATPVGLYRSADRGGAWTLITPPWPIPDMAWGADGRLYLARARGVAWSADVTAPTVVWHETAGYGRVRFFTVAPHPTDPTILWAGTWGNDIGSSRDGGQTMAGLGNGLETLSALAIWWHATPDQVTIATIEGLYRSDDGGSSWFRLPGPLAMQTVYTLYQDAAGTLWAGAADGLWQSNDYGISWQQVEALAGITLVRMGTFANETGQHNLWVGSERNGWWLSEDNGQSWQWGGLAGHTVFTVTTVAEQARQVGDHRLVVATDQGISSTAWPP